MININGTFCPVLIPNQDSYQSIQQPNNAWNVWQKPSSSNMPSPFQVFGPSTNFSNPMMHTPHHTEANTIQQAMRIKRLKTPTISMNKPKPINKIAQQFKVSVTKKPSRKAINHENKTENKTSFERVRWLKIYLKPNKHLDNLA